MNRRPLGLKLDKALTGFLQHKAAEALSPNTLIAYEHDLKLWIKYAGEVDVSQVTTQDLRAFLAWLHTDYKPHRFSGSEHPLAAIIFHHDRLARLSDAPRQPFAQAEPGNPIVGGRLVRVAGDQFQRLAIGRQQVQPAQLRVEQPGGPFDA